MFVLFSAFLFLFSKAFSQEPISVTKDSHNTPPSFSGEVEHVSIQSTLVPYDPRVIKPSNKRMESLPGHVTRESSVVEVKISNNLVPIQQRSALSSEKRVVPHANNPAQEPAYQEVILKPVPLTPYPPKK